MYKLVVDGQIIAWGDLDTLRKTQAIYGGIIRPETKLKSYGDTI